MAETTRMNPRTAEVANDNHEDNDNNGKDNYCPAFLLFHTAKITIPV